MAWRRSTPDFITGISPCAASAWGDGRLPAPCARDTAGDPRPHIAGSERRLVERRNLDFITGISPCAASAWGDGRLPAPCARDTAGDPRPHIAGSERRLVERRNLAGAVPAQIEHRLLPRDGNAEIACDIFDSGCHIVIRSWLGISVGMERLLATRDP